MTPAGSRRLVALAFAIATFGLLFWPAIVDLVDDWSNDDNYSHGFFIVPLALYFAWERRDRFAALSGAPSSVGLVLVGIGLVVLLAGLLGADRFLPRVAMIIVLVGAILFIRGWSTLRVAAFPVGFLLLMIPLPAIIFNEIAFPLQLLASRAGEVALSTAGVPVLREGNVIILAHTSLEVAEACSGIRSLISLMALGIVFGYFTDPRLSIRTAIALSTIPIAILANAARVAGTGFAAHYFGVEAALGFFHTFSGWLVFGVAFGLVFVVTRILMALVPEPPHGALPVTT
jgi:exosortase